METMEKKGGAVLKYPSMTTAMTPRARTDRTLNWEHRTWKEQRSELVALPRSCQFWQYLAWFHGPWSQEEDIPMPHSGPLDIRLVQSHLPFRLCTYNHCLAPHTTLQQSSHGVHLGERWHDWGSSLYFSEAFFFRFSSSVYWYGGYYIFLVSHVLRSKGKVGALSIIRAYEWNSVVIGASLWGRVLLAWQFKSICCTRPSLCSPQREITHFRPTFHSRSLDCSISNEGSCRW